jgi:aminoglycoside phosphotransferase (APT) family kinase protein
MAGEVVETDQSHEALVEACQRLGYDFRGAELLRRGTNAVYRLTSTPVIVRIAPDDAEVVGIRRQVAVARWLASAGVPVVRTVAVEQPIEAAGRQVTLWESVGDGAADDLSRYGTTAELGQILRQLHGLPAPDGVQLPAFDPLRRIEGRLATLSHLSMQDRDRLKDRAAKLARGYRALSFSLPTGPIHGDANVGNLLRASDGEAVLSDLDGFAIGPREWDLILTAIYTDRYGWHTEAEYQDFTEAYGFDVRQWGGYQVLGDVRELLMVLWNAGNAATDPGHARELAKRLESLRTGEGRSSWSPM